MSTILFVCSGLNNFNSYFLIQSCLTQEGQNVFHFDVLKQINQTIHREKSLSDENESSTFYENMFNSARHLTCQTLWLLFLFQYERVSKSCMTNVQSKYYDLFSSWFSESWSSFYQSGLDIEVFIVGVIIPALLPFCVKECIDFGFQVSI